MPTLPVCSGEEAIRAFAKDGWTMDRRKGSHVTLVKAGSVAGHISPVETIRLPNTGQGIVN